MGFLYISWARYAELRDNESGSLGSAADRFERGRGIVPVIYHHGGRHHDAIVVQLMKKDDMLHMLSKCITTTTRVIVFDLVRAAEHGEVDVVYEVIEMIKDQYLCSGKYDSTSKHLAPMHVIVFANFAPDTTMMSADRWHVHEIGSVAASSPPVMPLSMLALASAADDARASSPPPRAASSPLNPTTPSRPARGGRRRA